MLNDDELIRLFGLLDLSGDSDTDDIDCHRMQTELIDRWAAAQLESAADLGIDQAIQQIRGAAPEVGRHLLLCPDCRNHFETVYGLYQAAAREDQVLPQVHFDLGQLPAFGKNGPPSLVARIAGWLGTAASLAEQGETRLQIAPGASISYIPATEGFRQAEPELPNSRKDIPPVTVHITPSLEGGTLILEGYIRPSQPGWSKRPLHLYKIANALPFTMAELSPQSDFEFLALPPDDYILTLDLASGEIPLVIVPRNLWKLEE
jgi:hypothetical protein